MKIWQESRRASRPGCSRRIGFITPSLLCQSVLGPGGRGGGGAGGDTKYNDGLLFFGNHQALSSDQSPQCWRFKLNLIIHHLTADSLPKWNCSAVLVIMQMQAGWLTSSISRDNGPVLFSNRVLARQSVKYC